MSKKEISIKEQFKLPSPQEIKEYIDQYVIGQEETKRVLSVAVYNHYKKVLKNINGNAEFDKSNVIVVGNSGSGKTLIIKTIAKMLGVPCYIQDCTKITASGYVGSDVEECLVGLLRTCKYDVEAAEMGIVVCDEVDKIAKKDAGVSITRDVSGECVQQSLLKIVEGDLVGVPPQGGRKHPEQQLVYIDTTNILFISCGAFVGLDNIVKRRLGCNHIGFSDGNGANSGVVKYDEKHYTQYVNAEDIQSFGFIPEFVGRFPVITGVEKLEKEDLKRILTEPKNSLIKQYVDLLALDNTNLIFTDDALDKIVDLAYRLETGARALRAITETVMTDIMFDSPNNIGKKKPVEVIVDGDYVENKTCKKYLLKNVS